MYQNQIIALTLFKSDNKAILKLQPIYQQIFNKQTQELYKIIFDLTHKYHDVPTIAFLQEYFKLEKETRAKQYFYEIIEETPDFKLDTLALIDLQINYMAKRNIQDNLRSSLNSIKLINGSSLLDFTLELNDNLNQMARLLNPATDVEGLLYSNTEPNIIKETLIKEYDARATGTRGYYSFKTGIEHIDRIIGGVTNVDFIAILGFIKNGKSLLVRQLAYNALLQQKNVVFITLEMSYESIQHSFLSLHANNTQLWGLDAPRVTTNNIRQGTLSQQAEDFYKNKIIDDFTTNANYGSLYIKQPTSSYTIDEFSSDIRILQKTTMDIDLIVIDYPALMRPRERSRDGYNELFRELRQFSLQKHIPIIFPVQSNREGHKLALKDKDNLYAPEAISDYNAIERDATNVISIIITDDMRTAGQAQLQHLLARETGLFNPIKVNLDFETGFITDLQEFSKEDTEQIIDEIDL